MQALLLAAQLSVGGVLGFLVFLVFAAIQSAGALIDLFAGFSLAQAFDPGAFVNGAQFTRLLHLVALALLLTSGGYWPPPGVCSQRPSRQLAMSRNRMIAAVGAAGVVLRHPTQVAVALK